MMRFALALALLSASVASANAAGTPDYAAAWGAPACKIVKKDDGTYICPDDGSSGRWRIGTGARTCTQQLKPTRQDEICAQVWAPADWAGRAGF